MEVQEGIAKRQSMCDTLHRVPKHISQVVEHIFYRLGFKIAQHPYRWIIGSFVIIVLCISGLYRFRQEKNPLKLWVPPDSDFVLDAEWLMSRFGQTVRVQTVILTGENILEPRALVKLNEITKQVLGLQTSDKPPVSWVDVCLKIPVISGLTGKKDRLKRDVNIFEDDFFDEEPGVDTNGTVFEPSVHVNSELYCSILNSLPKACLVLSILDIWDFDTSEIEKDSVNQIIAKINRVKISPTLGHYMNFTELLGGVTIDNNGRIIAAKAVKTHWMVYVNLSNVDEDAFGNDAGTSDWATEDVMSWEEAYLQLLEKTSDDLRIEKNKSQPLTLSYDASRSFGDISSSTLFQDIDKLVVGVLLMFLYVQIILSNFNWVEWRFILTATGLLCVGGAFIVAIGVCSLIGIPYGPVHTSLPFMLLGLGVDDLFVMMASWKQIHCYDSVRKTSLQEQIALMLGHAGSAICITSLTDVVAFLIGAFTILPSLQSFCFYAAVGVLVNFLLQITLFIGFFTLDAERIKKKRNGMVPCIVHQNYVPQVLDPSEAFSWKFIDCLYSRIVFTIPGKVIIMLITIAMASVGIIGTLQLEQWFDPIWFLPNDSYLNKHIAVSHQYYSDSGFDASVFMGDIDYAGEFPKIINMTETLNNQTYVQSVIPWPNDFADFVVQFYQIDLRTTKLENPDFQYYLSKFLFSKAGGRYQKNFHFERTLMCGEHAPKISVASIDFSYVRFVGPHQWIPAMDGAKAIAKDAGINGFVTVWSKIFGTWVTDKLIAQEVLRNVTLALLCVMGTTSLLIAEPQTCFWILICVLLTLLNVCGFMFFWGLTIDMVSCIGLELAIGLSVDYAAHVAHAFLNASSREGHRDRKVRALVAMRHIGAAVAYGAGSTMLALSMLCFSKAYVFRAFFKIFFLVIVFGLWHGLLMLPVILSTIGPRSLRTQERPYSPEKIGTIECDVDRPLNKETES